MANESNLLDISETTFNALRKPDVKKVVVGDKIKSLCTHVKVLTETVSQLLTKNDRLNND